MMTAFTCISTFAFLQAALAADAEAGEANAHELDKVAAAATRMIAFWFTKYSKRYLKNAKNTQNPDLGPISFWVFQQYVYQNCVNGLDLNRFCVPEHIVQMPNS